MEEFVFFPFLIVLIFLLCYLVKRWKESSKNSKEGISNRVGHDGATAQADQRINNISSSVPGQNPPHYPDAYLSVEHIMVANELNKSPKYNEAPPSYAEAMKLAMAHSNSLQTYQAEQEQSGQQLEATTATTSTTPIAATHQPPSVPNERF